MYCAFFLSLATLHCISKAQCQMAMSVGADHWLIGLRYQISTTIEWTVVTFGTNILHLLSGQTFNLSNTLYLVLIGKC